MAHLIYLYQYFTPPTAAGGTRSWEFSHRLARDGNHISMISGDSHLSKVSMDKALEAYSGYQGQFKLNAIHLDYSNHMSYSRRILAFFYFAFMACKKILQESKVDLVFASSTPLTTAIPALIRKWLRGTPYIFEVRDLWPDMPISIGALRSPFTIFMARQLERIAYQNASYIVALSPGMRDGIIRCGISAEKIEVIPNACDNARFKVPDSIGLEFLQQHPELANGPLVVYIGTLGRINGVSYLARLASCCTSLIPNAKFLVIGAGACEAEIRELSQELDILGKNFWMWSEIPKQEVPKILSACTTAISLFIPIAGVENNSANKFFDALSAGRPVVVNYGGWQKDLLEKSGAGMSLPGNDPETGAIQLANFLSNSEGLQSARRAARHLADTEFDRDFLYQKLANLFQKVIADN
jgi:glycosyltransferase involved in cell wall biosynthesis